MTQLGEAVSLSILSHEDHDENSCAFCNATPEPTSEKNTLVDHFDEDESEVPGVNKEGLEHKNSSGDLGSALVEAGYAQKSNELDLSQFPVSLPAKFTKPLKVNSAAHHIIPGNASLVESDIMEYLHTDDMAEGNIGYNVNNYENGVWLSGNYALRGGSGMPKWGKEGKDFTKDTKLQPYEYAKRAITKSKCQFHDAHTDYNELLIKTLDLVAEKYETTEDVWCSDGKKSDGKPPQLPMLVMRLNTISRRLKPMLENPCKSWKKDVYTSRFSKRYICEEIYGDKYVE
ncbi:AHH domain-containing protein [Teredinibacter franksiae]|uniref:AHH domain-containing protein n=1 Tax=Teredinibacter franksiae TaxID=2761453 RepID=UPI00162A01C8|nr:AHH domain-containing protein [Teredinibacter franksiae]